jgi:hypothetical protein
MAITMIFIRHSDIRHFVIQDRVILSAARLHRAEPKDLLFLSM